jgi:hypothetical protein
MKTKSSRLILAMMAGLIGCNLTQPTLRKDDLPPVVGGGGKMISPKRNAIQMKIAARPLEDEVLGDVLWNAADVQSVPDEARQVLAANGLRAAVITGELPTQVQAVLDAPPPNRIDPMILVLNNGDGLGVPIGTDTAKLEIMFNRQGKVVGKTFEDARGQLRISANQDADEGVKVRITPELHHGPVRQGWEAAPGGGSFAPHQFVPKNGQTEESFRELAVELNLRPGQVAIISGVPERQSNLGSFLFTAQDGTSDRIIRKVLFIWAARAELGSPPGHTPPPPPANLREVEPPDMPAQHMTDTTPDVHNSAAKR